MVECCIGFIDVLMFGCVLHGFYRVVDIWLGVAELYLVGDIWLRVPWFDLSGDCWFYVVSVVSFGC